MSNISLNELLKYKEEHGGYLIKLLNGTALVGTDRFLFVAETFPYRLRKISYGAIKSVTEVPNNMILIKVYGEDNLRLDTISSVHDELYDYLIHKIL